MFGVVVYHYSNNLKWNLYKIYQTDNQALNFACRYTQKNETGGHPSEVESRRLNYLPLPIQSIGDWGLIIRVIVIDTLLLYWSIYEWMKDMYVCMYVTRKHILQYSLMFISDHMHYCIIVYFYAKFVSVV